MPNHETWPFTERPRGAKVFWYEQYNCRWLCRNFKQIYWHVSRIFQNQNGWNVVFYLEIVQDIFKQQALWTCMSFCFKVLPLATVLRFKLIHNKVTVLKEVATMIVQKMTQTSATCSLQTSTPRGLLSTSVMCRCKKGKVSRC